jgi:hypothetical protein
MTPSTKREVRGIPKGGHNNIITFWYDIIILLLLQCTGVYWSITYEYDA